MQTFNFNQHINEPTRITKTSATCLDLIFTNFNPIKMSFQVLEYGLSDHKGVLINMKNTPLQSKQLFYKDRRIFNERQINLFKTRLKEIDWNNFLKKENGVNENYNSFLQLINKILDETIPIRKLKINAHRNKKWLTKGVKISCKHKRLLRILNSQTKTKNPILEEYYKKYSKLLKATITRSKKITNINKIKRSSNVTKTMWQIVRQSTNKISKRSQTNIKLKTSGSLTEDPHVVANTFNNYFVSVGAHDNAASPPQGRPVTSPLQNSLFLSPVDSKEVIEILRRLKNKTSCGFDNIPPMLIKKCAEELVHPLTFIINQSFDEGIVPDKLKISIIKPIHKSGDSNIESNFRPIALLPSFSKVFEYAMTSRLNSFFEKFKVFNESQYGFRKNRSTTIAIFKFIQKVLNIINNKGYAVGILLDLSKAYDRVLPNILLQKLYDLGVRGKAHNWLISYFKDRVQYVEVQHTCSVSNQIRTIQSEKVIVKKSIPQGSIMGCFLFLVYINDLPKVLEEDSILFADDMSIVFPASNDLNLNAKLQAILTNLISWLEDHNLNINFNKTKIMLFQPYQKQTLQLNFTINGNNIEQVDNATLLGVKLDSNLHWKYHIECIGNKLCRFAYALNELKRTTDTNTARIAYLAYAQSWLRYGIPLWGNSTDVPKLLTLQKKCIRILANIDQMTSCKPFFKEFNILTVTSLYILETCKLVRNNLNLFIKSDDNYTGAMNLRKRNKFVLPKTSMTLVGSGPYSMAIKLYNSLPNYIREIDNYNKYVKCLNNYLIEKCYYKLNEFYKPMQ